MADFAISFSDIDNIFKTEILDNESAAVGFDGNSGPPGKTPDISMAAHELDYGSAPTVVKSGTAQEPFFDLGIPAGKPAMAEINSIQNDELESILR